MIHFQSDRPLFVQIAEVLKTQILNGQIEFDSRLPSIRELSLEYRVNPNTVQKALSILEEEKLIETRRTQGKFVIFRPDQIKKQREKEAQKIGLEFLVSMNELGFDKEDAIRLLEELDYDS